MLESGGGVHPLVGLDDRSSSGEVQGCPLQIAANRGFTLDRLRSGVHANESPERKSSAGPPVPSLPWRACSSARPTLFHGCTVSQEIAPDIGRRRRQRIGRPTKFGAAGSKLLVPARVSSTERSHPARSDSRSPDRLTGWAPRSQGPWTHSRGTRWRSLTNPESVDRVAIASATRPIGGPRSRVTSVEMRSTAESKWLSDPNGRVGNLARHTVLVDAKQSLDRVEHVQEVIGWRLAGGGLDVEDVRRVCAFSALRLCFFASCFTKSSSSTRRPSWRPPSAGRRHASIGS